MYLVTMGPVGTSVVTVCWSVVTILLCQGKSSLSDKWLKSLEIQLLKVSGWVGGHFDYSVSPGPSFSVSDIEC